MLEFRGRETHKNVIIPMRLAEIAMAKIKRENYAFCFIHGVIECAEEKKRKIF